MLMTRAMPCLLLRNGRLVKTVRFRAPSYVGDPVNAIKIYNEKEVDELILVDITATVEQRPPPFELLAELVDECFMPLCYGGGICRTEDIRRLFGLGIEKVAINSHALTNPEFVREAAEMFGSQSIVVAIDARRGMLGRCAVYTESGRRKWPLDPVRHAHHMEELGAGEILLNAIHRDGTWEGYDLELIRAVSDAIRIPLIALGGAGSVADFGAAVNTGGASAVAAGSMAVYQGSNLGVLINFPTRAQLQAVLEQNRSGPDTAQDEVPA